MKIVLHIVFALMIVPRLYPEDTSHDKPLVIRETKIRFISETKASVAMADKNPDTVSEITLSRKSPSFSQLFSFQLHSVANRSYYHGFYTSHEIEFQLDNNQYRIDPFLETVTGQFQIGYQTAKLLTAKSLKDSRIGFYFPVYLDYRAVMNSDYKPKALSRQSLYHFEYNSYLSFGTGFLFSMDIRSRKSFIGFQLDTGAVFLIDTLPGNYQYNNPGVFLRFPFVSEFSFAPFNFISKDIDIWFKLKNDFKYDFRPLNSTLRNQLYLEIKWSGFRYLQLGFKPFTHHFEMDIPTQRPEMPYNQDQRIGMEISISSEIRFFEVEFRYKPVLFSIYKTEYNLDPYKPHQIELIFKFDVKN